ncbi:MAG: hypothetical protein HUJ71_01845 [Pseudobutyrivibrio sp.]|nr:hypothetical protein [Pseudobutyrivibrio sp.]
MYDTIELRLSAFTCNADFLQETPCYFDVKGEHVFNGVRSISGYLGNLKIYCSAAAFTIKGGSLCKWYLGDNYKTMSKGDAQRAIEALSDTLHLPIEKAAVTRIDFAQNFIVKQPPSNYFEHLGELAYMQRLQQPHGLYYSNNKSRLAFYDKNKEMQKERVEIPLLYVGRNVLRYEQRFLHRLPQQLNSPEVTASMLYDNAFYGYLLTKWADAYKAIKKINDTTLNFNVMTTKKDLHQMGVLALVQIAGGQTNMLAQIKAAARAGKLSGKQAYDIKQAVLDDKIRADITTPNEAIMELDRKIIDAVKLYS